MIIWKLKSNSCFDTVEEEKELQHQCDILTQYQVASR
jgi:hypothetical protein